MAELRQLEALLTPVVEDRGMDLVDLEYVTEHSGWVLRLFVDRPGGVTVEDCARVSRDCSTVLDAEDVVQRRYRLEVSSPGVERRLRKQAHFQSCLGQRVHVILREPLEGRKRVTGELLAVKNESIDVASHDGVTVTIPYQVIKRANLKVF